MNTGMTATVCDTPPLIRGFRLLAMRSALLLECKGLRMTRRSMYQQVKREFGFKGNKQSVADQFTQYLKDQRILIVG